MDAETYCIGKIITSSSETRQKYCYTALSARVKYRLDETAAEAARMPNSQAWTVASSSSPASRTGYAMNAASMN
jgi:hypothetical protein